jgi:hypothetical protein
MFQDAAKVKTLRADIVWGDFGKHWESDQNVVTARVLRLGLCSVPRANRLTELFLANSTKELGAWDATCYMGQGWGECRHNNFGQLQL